MPIQKLSFFGFIALTCFVGQRWTFPQQQDRSLLKINVQEVDVNVEVVDAQGTPVTGLSKSDFQVKEDGKEQTISSFREIRHSLSPSIHNLGNGEQHATTFLNVAGIDVGASSNVVYIDLDPGEDPVSLGLLRGQLIKFFQTKPAGAQLAIFVGRSQPRMLQGFTASQQVLATAVRSQRVLTSGGIAVGPVADSFEDDRARIAAMKYDSLFDHLFGGVPQSEHTGDSSMGFSDAAFAARSRMCSTGMLGLLRLARYLAAVPGRKNVIWITHPFMIGAFDNKLGSFDCTDQLKQTSSLLSTAGITVYGVDLRPLAVAPGYDVDAQSAPEAGTIQNWALRRRAGDSTLELVATQTGGFAVYNTNSFVGSMKRAITQGSNYYALTYRPSSPSREEGFRRIQVSLQHPIPGTRLDYRKGYWFTANAGSQEIVSKNVDELLRSALQIGFPPLTDLPFWARIECDQPDSPPSSAHDAQKAAAPCDDVRFRQLDRTHRTSQNVTISLSIIPSVILPILKKNENVEITYGVAAYDASGEEVHSDREEVTGVMTPSLQNSIAQEGLQFSHDLQLPSNWRYLRVAVCEVSHPLCGSIEIDAR